MSDFSVASRDFSPRDEVGPIEEVEGREGVRTHSSFLAARALITSFLWAGTPALQITAGLVRYTALS